MIDRRDFDEWWARECNRARGDLGCDAMHWAERGFLAAASMMSSELKRQKQRAALVQPPKAREPALSPPMSNYVRTLPARHEANLPGAELAALLVKRAQGKP